MDQLAAHAGLLRLAKVLTLLVGLAVLGCVLNGAITVLISTLMSVRAKTFEIGILRAHGFRDREVLAIFLLQAVLLGGLALVFAVAVVGLAEPWVRELMCGAVGTARQRVRGGVAVFAGRAVAGGRSRRDCDCVFRGGRDDSGRMGLPLVARRGVAAAGMR